MRRDHQNEMKPDRRSNETENNVGNFQKYATSTDSSSDVREATRGETASDFRSGPNGSVTSQDASAIISDRHRYGRRPPTHRK